MTLLAGLAAVVAVEDLVALGVHVDMVVPDVVTRVPNDVVVPLVLPVVADSIVVIVLVAVELVSDADDVGIW